MSSSYPLLLLASNLLVVLSTCMYASQATFFPPPPPPPPPCPSPPPPPRNNTLTFYLQVVFPNGTNDAVANIIPVAGIQGKPFGQSQFGTVFVFDTNITTTPSPNSTVVGHAYGTFDVVGLDGFIYLISSTYVFTSGEFAGNTLVSLGIFDMSKPVSNLPIIGGTNVFTYATGYAANQILSTQPNFVVQITANYKTAA